MDIKDLAGKVPNELLESLEKRGIRTLTPPQELALKKGLLSGNNFVIAAPTASGKTLIAEMAMLKSVIWDRKKAVYIAPMRALVREKYVEFKETYPFLKVAMSIGDLDALDRWLEDFDIIFVSTEKFDSLIRHGLTWMESIGCIIVDEVHMLDESGRGPTLEILVSKLKRMCSSSQIVALSATVGNSDELADWMNAQLVQSDYRPVLLEKGIELEGMVSYDSGREEKLESSNKIAELRIAEDTLVRSKQVLMFYGTKRNAEAGAERAGGMVVKYLSANDKAELEVLSKKVLNALSRPTAQCEKLAKCILSGTAFHHSGLVNEQRELVENGFRENKIKTLCSTTTLCLPQGEEIICNPEAKQIQDICSGDKVLGSSGIFREVITPTKRKYKGELIEIRPYFQLPMSMTLEHRVLIVDRKRHNSHYHNGISKFWWTYSAPYWTEAKNLKKKGHMLLFPRIRENKLIKKIELGDNGPLINQTGVVGKHWTKLKADRLNLDSDTMEIMGLFIAEGSTGKNGVLKFDISTLEEDLTDKIVMWGKSLGLIFKIRDAERHRRSVVGCSKQVALIFRDMFGHNASNKHMPAEFLYLPKNKLIPFIRGMWLGDGSIYKKRTFGSADYSTVSKTLAKQMFMALVKIGYMPRIKYTKSKKTKEKSFYKVSIPKHGNIYRVAISGKQLTNFAKEVLNKKLNFSGNRTYNLGKIDEDYYYMPIKEISTRKYEGDVYNLEVVQDASYVGSFIVHNSLGINLPAHTVVVRDITRYGEHVGNEYIGINEVTQLFGRAGRPKYDKSGRGILISKSKGDAQDLYNRYILSDLDPITSKLGILPVLRTHVLAFIATRFVTSDESILDFMQSTFYGHQYSNSRELKEIINAVLVELEKWQFVEKKGSVYNATRIGHRVSELYIDPLSARWMLDCMPKLTDDVSILFMISNTIEMRPYVKTTEKAEETFFEYQHLIEDSPSGYDDNDFMYYDPIKPFSTALMLKDWISEKGERDIIKDYRSTPGALYAKITNADWLLYAGMEMSKLSRINNVKLLEMRLRVKYGIKDELMDLIRLEGVGRVRARLMFNSGIRKVYDIRKKESQSLINTLFGKEIAGKIISQVAAVDDADTV